MNKAQRQVVAEKIGSTVRVLELLGLDYLVSAPRNKREGGNRSPRVIYVNVGKAKSFRIYNSVTGNTWANEPSGKPVPGVKTIEDVYSYLSNTYKGIGR